MEKTRSLQAICLYCFNDLDENGVCVSCGRSDSHTPAPPHQLPARTLLHKRYLIVRALGEGGFGITYLAWNLKTGQKVAIKEYYPGSYVARDPKSEHMVVTKRQNYASLSLGLERFIDEAKTLSRLNTLKGIVSVLDFFPANNTAYLVMEYLDGLSLKRYIQKKGTVSADTILTILKPVIMSLKEVHAMGLIHRDISPDNIIITRDNEVKLIDFGAAKNITADGQKLSVILKQGFAPEEQYRKSGEQGPWTDIYAIGVTIYYCITGQIPPESVQRLYEDTLIPPARLGAGITPIQEECLLKALAVRKDDRFLDLDECIEAFYYGITAHKNNAPPDADKPAPIDEEPSLSPAYFDEAEPPPETDSLFDPAYYPIAPEPGGDGTAAHYYGNVLFAPRASVTAMLGDPFVQIQRIENDGHPLDPAVTEVTLPSGLERFKLGLKAALKKLLSGAGLTVKLLGIVCFKALRLLFIGLKKAIRLLFIGVKKGGQAAGRALKRPFTKKAAATPEPPPAETTE